MTEHEHALEVAALIRDGLAAPVDRTAAERHLAGCASCRAVAARLPEVDAYAATLATELTPSTPPPWTAALADHVGGVASPDGRASARPPAPGGPAARTAPKPGTGAAPARRRRIRSGPAARPLPERGTRGPARRPATRARRVIPALVAVAVLVAVVAPAVWLRYLRTPGAEVVDQPAPPPVTAPPAPVRPRPGQRAQAERVAEEWVHLLWQRQAGRAWALLSPSAKAATRSPDAALDLYLVHNGGGYRPSPGARYEAVRVPTRDGVLRWVVFTIDTYRQPELAQGSIAVVHSGGRAMIDEHPARTTRAEGYPDWRGDGGPFASLDSILWKVIPSSHRGRLEAGDVRLAWIVVDRRVLPAEVRAGGNEVIEYVDGPCCNALLHVEVRGVGRLGSGPHRAALVLQDADGRFSTQAVWFIIR